MAAILNIQSTSREADKTTLRLIHAAVDNEIHRLEMAIILAEKRLALFEQKYHVSSSVFIETYAAEDLTGGDDEYVEWAGEYRLCERLREHLRRLREVEYADF
jgi:hypothetical protein